MDANAAAESDESVQIRRLERGQSLSALTSLRFFAAFAIVLYHLRWTLPTFYTKTYFDNFAIGVEFFFVLSGFILYYKYGNQTKLNLKEFYVKRFVRVYPLHWLTLGVWCYFFLAVRGVSRSYLLKNGLANFTLTHALLPGYGFSLGFNAVSWSLSNEIFFYALFPLLRSVRVAMFALAGVTIYLVTASLLGYHVAANVLFPNYTYFCPLIRVAEFCAGIVMAHLFSTSTKLKCPTFLEFSVLAALGFQIAFTSTPDFNLSQLPFLLIFSLLIWVFAHEQGALSLFLARSRTFLLLGEASFSLYMVHHMVLCLCGTRFRFGTKPWIVILSGIVIAVALSVLLFKFFENPSRGLLTRILLRQRHKTLGPAPVRNAA